MHDSSDVTQLLLRWGEGDEAALEALVPVLYDELKAMAHARLRRERPGHTLSTTALVHEAYVRLVDLSRIDWQDRAHFLAVASRTMRRILVDYARRRRAQKRGGPAEDLPLDEELLPAEKVDLLLDLDEALERE